VARGKEEDGGRGKGSTFPEMCSVMFGCVSAKGAVETAAMGIGGASPPVGGGKETVNGREGQVRLKDTGAGSGSVARAARASDPDDEYTLKDWRVTSSERGGAGSVRGMPGIGGTECGRGI
jgi:hypothetical protein